MKKLTMKSKIKKAVSVLLTAAMVCTGTVVTSFAEEEGVPATETLVVEETMTTEESAGAESIVSETETSARETETVQEAETAKETETSNETEIPEEAETAEILTETESMTETGESETGAAEETVKLAFADTDIAHGTYTENGSDIKWVIDKDGKLTVEGTGDFAPIGGDASRVPWYYERESIKTAEINVTGVKDASYMFWYYSSLKSVDVSKFDTSSVTNMESMFCGCSSLASLDVSKFDTSSVQQMRYMFNGCSSLASLDVSSFNTANVTDMSGMFQGCSSLKSVDVSKFNTSNVTGMMGMFNGCSSLANVDVSSFNTANVTGMAGMFQGCGSLTSVDVSSFNTANVTDIADMFNGCISLTEIDLSSFDLNGRKHEYYDTLSSSFTKIKMPRNGSIKLPLGIWTDEAGKEYTDSFTGGSESILLTRKKMSGEYEGIKWEIDSEWKLTVTGSGNFKSEDGNAPWYGYAFRTAVVSVEGMTDASGMFSGCDALQSVDFSGTDMGSVTYMDNMFYGCSSLKSLDLSRFNTANVTSVEQMFGNCGSLKSLDVSSFNTANVTSMHAMFSGCSSLASLNLSSFDTTNVTDMYGMFYGCSSLASLDLSKFKTANVANMGAMFYGCRGLTSLDLSKFDTSSVAYMSDAFGRGMFYGCSSLTSLDLSSFDTKKVVDMCGMFSNCSSLASLDLSRLDTRSVQQMNYMFNGCSGLTNLDLSKFDTSSVTRMGGMFSGCSGLTSLDLSKFSTSSVTRMDNMFSGCSSLTSLDLSKFDTSKVTHTNYMFSGCRGLTSLALSKFDTSKVMSMEGMFSGCIALTSLDVSKFDTSKVTSMSYMFSGCRSLTSLDLSKFDTSKAMYIEGMFYGCSSFTSLDLSRLDMKKVFEGRYFLNDCASLVKILTPLNVKESLTISLPGSGWKDAKGNAYASLPTGKSSSMELKMTDGSGTETPPVTGPDDDSYYPDDDRTDLNDAKINAKIEPIKDVAYSGSAYTPAVKVTVKTDDNKTVMLAEGTDYRVAYSNNVNAGTATVTVSGNGRYKGTLPAEFEIKAKPINKAKILTGAVIKGAADVSKLPVSVYDGTRLLKYGEDYTLEGYSKDTGKVTVKGKGNYDKETAVTAKLAVYEAGTQIISSGDISFNDAQNGSSEYTVAYTGKPVKPEVTVTVNEHPLDPKKDYSVQYQNNKNAGTAFVIVTGKGAYKGKAAAAFKIAAVTGTMTVTLPQNKTYTYSGKPQKPAVTVTVKDDDGKEKKLSKKDYMVTYINNVHAGDKTAVVKVTGIGNYEGMTAEEPFTIKQQDIRKIAVKGTKENLILTYNKRTLAEGTDYTLEWEKEEKNKVAVTITGKGDFDPQKSVTKTVKVK